MRLFRLNQRIGRERDLIGRSARPTVSRFVRLLEIYESASLTSFTSRGGADACGRDRVRIRRTRSRSTASCGRECGGDFPDGGALGFRPGGLSVVAAAAPRLGPDNGVPAGGMRVASCPAAGTLSRLNDGISAKAGPGAGRQQPTGVAPGEAYGEHKPLWVNAVGRTTKRRGRG